MRSSGWLADNNAGFTIPLRRCTWRATTHSASWHTMLTAGMAVAAQEQGCCRSTMSMVLRRTSYHDYEGIALDLDGATGYASRHQHNAMIPSHHGLLTKDERSPRAFSYNRLEQAGRIQIAATQAARR